MQTVNDQAQRAQAAVSGHVLSTHAAGACRHMGTQDLAGVCRTCNASTIPHPGTQWAVWENKVPSKTWSDCDTYTMIILGILKKHHGSAFEVLWHRLVFKCWSCCTPLDLVYIYTLMYTLCIYIYIYIHIYIHIHKVQSSLFEGLLALVGCSRLCCWTCLVKILTCWVQPGPHCIDDGACT